MQNNEDNKKENSLTKLPTLSRKEASILQMLLESKRELFGLEMVEASAGVLKRGTIYVTLQRMKEKGFVNSKPEARVSPEIGIPRRVYWATGLGEQLFMAYQAAHATLALDIITAKA